MTTKWIIGTVGTLAILALAIDIGVLYQRSRTTNTVAHAPSSTQATVTPVTTAAPTTSTTATPAATLSSPSNTNSSSVNLQAVDKTLANFDSQTKTVDTNLSDQQSDLSE